MSKRISPEDRVIEYFMSQGFPLAMQMLSTVRAIMRTRGAEPSSAAAPKPAERRKRSRKPIAPKTITSSRAADGPATQNKQMNRDYVAAQNEAAS